MIKTAMNPADEFAHANPGQENWTESFMFQAYSPESRVGVFFHVGRASWGDPEMWLERLTVNLPDGRVAVSGAYRRGTRAKGGGTDACWADCLEPYGAWEVGFNAAVTVTDIDEMMQGRLRMGAQSPLKMVLNWRPIGPIWDQRDMKIDSLKAVHYEQAGWMSGTVEIDGQTIPFDGPGRRDRSWGVRNLGSLEEHTILHGEFPEAEVYFATAWLRVNDQPPTAARGYAAFGEAIEDVVAHLPTTTLFSPPGTSFEATLETSRGDLKITGKALQTFTHTLIRPNGVAFGTDLESELPLFWATQVELELDGQRGYGFMERSGKGDVARAAARAAGARS